MLPGMAKAKYSLEREVMRMAVAIGADDDDVRAAYAMALALADAVEKRAPELAGDLPRMHRRMELAGYIARLAESRP